MITKPFKVFIGKDVARDTDVVGGIGIGELINTAGTYPLKDGDIVILDKNMDVLTPGNTIVDSDTIYVAMGTSVTYSVTNEAGTTITARKIVLSDPIVGAYVTSYSGKAYTAKAEQVWTADLTGLTPVAGNEYILRVVYKDMYEHPGQFIQQWNHTAVAADAVVDCHVFGAAMAALVNADPNARVSATWTDSGDTLALTAKPIPSCTTGVDDIDEFSMVMFEPYLNYIDNSATGDGSTWNTFKAFSITTDIEHGTGNWENVRDLEKSSWGYRGVWNTREFPVINPSFHTVKSTTYHTLIIESSVLYKTPNNFYDATTALRTHILFTDGTNGDATQAFVLSQLNPWMASTPRAFANVAAM